MIFATPGSIITLGDAWGGGTAKQRAQVRAWVEEWREALFLQPFTIHIEICKQDCKDDPRANADVSVNLDYHTAHVRVFPRFWAALVTDDERRYFLLHELCHRFTKRLRTLAFDALNEKLVRQGEIINADEEMTDLVAKVIWHLVNLAAGTAASPRGTPRKSRASTPRRVRKARR